MSAENGSSPGKQPLVVHVIHRLAVGGMENGLVNLINWMPEDRYRHAIVCLTDFDDFRFRLRREIPILALGKREGKDLGVYWRFRRAIRRLRPAIVHTRNLPSLEYQLASRFCGVRRCVHGEHGRDVYDLDGTNRKYNMLRRAVRPFVSRYVVVSRDLQDWLVRAVGVTSSRISQIYNGVDKVRFAPGDPGVPDAPEGFFGEGRIIVGATGRLEPVKDQVTLVKAFIRALEIEPSLGDRLRLLVVGEGSLMGEMRGLLEAAGASGKAWLAGRRDDVPDLMRCMSVFVLPSLAEGISNTILEAMSTGLPVIATAVGGNPELVREGETGSLVPSSDSEAMARAILEYATRGELVGERGTAGRRRVEQEFSMERMVEQYMAVYDACLT